MILLLLQRNLELEALHFHIEPNKKTKTNLLSFIYLPPQIDNLSFSLSLHESKSVRTSVEVSIISKEWKRHKESLKTVNGRR